ncbi:MAG: hypothetical protein FWF71_00190, partial [Actinomycetia bacterium]|nr:hypothetical protein [Actinomycetes bacterium]
MGKTIRHGALAAVAAAALLLCSCAPGDSTPYAADDEAASPPYVIDEAATRVGSCTITYPVIAWPGDAAVQGRANAAIAADAALSPGIYSGDSTLTGDIGYEVALLD